jgi:hypothetical protein
MKSEFQIPRHLLLDLVKVTAASLLMGAFILAFGDRFQGTPGLAAIIIISACIYFVAIFILRILDTADTDMFKKLVVGWRGEMR